MYQVGDRVYGEYHGVDFRGVITKIEPDWTEGSYRASPGRFHLYVRLDTEIEPGRDTLFLGSVLRARNYSVRAEVA